MVLFLGQNVYLLRVVLENVGNDAKALTCVSLLQISEGEPFTQAGGTPRDDEDLSLEVRDVSLGIECVAAAEHVDG